MPMPKTTQDEAQDQNELVATDMSVAALFNGETSCIVQNGSITKYCVLLNISNNKKRSIRIDPGLLQLQTADGGCVDLQSTILMPMPKTTQEEAQDQHELVATDMSVVALFNGETNCIVQNGSITKYCV